MAHLFAKKYTKVGARPGTLVIAKDADKSRVQIIRYTPAEVSNCEVETVQEIRAELSKDGVVWIDVQGLGDEKLIREIGDLFSIHMLTLEDVVNVPQRPKTETFDSHPTLLLVMLSTAVGMLIYFKRLGWIWAGKNDDE